MVFVELVFINPPIFLHKNFGVFQLYLIFQYFSFWSFRGLKRIQHEFLIRFVSFRAKEIKMFTIWINATIYEGLQGRIMYLPNVLRRLSDCSLWDSRLNSFCQLHHSSLQASIWSIDQLQVELAPRSSSIKGVTKNSV